MNGSRCRLLAAGAVLAVGLGVLPAAAADEPETQPRQEQTGETVMADEATVQEAEDAVKAAETELNDYLGGTVTRGIVLDENRGKRLRELRANLDAAKKRLDDAKNQ